MPIHDLINEFSEFFNDLATLLADLSGFIGIISLPLMFVPPLGTALAVGALALTAGSAAIKTSLYVGHARDANGDLYVSGGDLVKSYVDVGLGAVGIGVAAGATRATNAAANAAKATATGARTVEKATFGKALAEQFSRETFRQAGAAPGKLVQFADRFGAKATAQVYWRQTASQFAAGAPGQGYNIGGLVFSGVSPMPTSDDTWRNAAGWQAPVHLFRDDITTILSNAPDTPDLQIKVQPTIGAPSPEPTPSIRPVEPPIRPVMDR